MLSQETAVGAHPVGAVAMMVKIAVHTEKFAAYEEWNERRVRRDDRDPAYTLAHSACTAARELHLDALVVPTLTGRSARLVSAHRPEAPIYALSLSSPLSTPNAKPKPGIAPDNSSAFALARSSSSRVRTWLMVVRSCSAK